MYIYIILDISEEFSNVYLMITRKAVQFFYIHSKKVWTKYTKPGVLKNKYVW